MVFLTTKIKNIMILNENTYEEIVAEKNKTDINFHINIFSHYLILFSFLCAFYIF